ncbi:MAG: hypothetical protein L6264_02240 [Weeksellaceae bacterium]|uniref:hypothetical protein n=1 Tax=Kaistella soli TaxID=2849654 RepID=UPI001C25F12F|nr:hypothetical protein [Kaistella soli]MBU4538448.1 hypothetical protein [Bacteroidota bacterium]MBU8882887.1 hypothetical protein [Kaistella soli]MCG2779744.1 hypothetical protein [Weeksellaceae bacterium]
MGNSENTNPQDGKKSRSKYVSAEQLIAKMKVAFTNAKEPEILSELATVGITETQLDDHLTEIGNLEQLSQQQKMEYGEQYAETDKFNLKREEIDAAFTRHRNLAKIVFKGDRQANTTLGIEAGRKQAYAAWFQQVSNFYAQILANPAFKAKAASVNIDDATIGAQQTALVAISALKESQKKELGEAQRATDIRDTALDLLYPKYTQLVAFAKVLFRDDQTLEKLGIIVKRERSF